MPEQFYGPLFSQWPWFFIIIFFPDCQFLLALSTYNVALSPADNRKLATISNYLVSRKYNSVGSLCWAHMNINFRNRKIYFSLWEERTNKLLFLFDCFYFQRISKSKQNGQISYRAEWKQCILHGYFSKFIVCLGRCWTLTEFWVLQTRIIYINKGISLLMTFIFYQLEMNESHQLREVSS